MKRNFGFQKPSHPYPGYATEEFATLGFCILVLSGVATLFGSFVIGLLVFFP